MCGRILLSYLKSTLLFENKLGKILLVVLLTFIFLWCIQYYYKFDFFYRGSNVINNINIIETLHAACLIILTICLVSIAWIQLSGIGETAKADFLMRLDDRYGSAPIIKARQIIQRLYRESKADNPHAPEAVHRYYIGCEIDKISEDINRSEDYVYLLNLLELLETISFFANRGNITPDDINDLMGLSLDFFHTIFKPRIDARRYKYSNKSFYTEFEKLVSKVKTENL